HTARRHALWLSGIQELAVARVRGDLERFPAGAVVEGAQARRWPPGAGAGRRHLPRRALGTKRTLLRFHNEATVIPEDGAKRPVTATLVKVLVHRRNDRGMSLEPYASRCIRQGEIHELVTTDHYETA